MDRNTLRYEISKLTVGRGLSEVVRESILALIERTVDADLRSARAALARTEGELRGENAFLREWLRGECSISDTDIDLALAAREGQP